MFAATDDVEILGMCWSANRTWKVPDHRVEMLQSLEMPCTITEETRSLYIPPLGAPLTLCVDAAAVGIGAVSLAHHVQDSADDETEITTMEEKLLPVAYFSKVFDGSQGYRHSTWRKAKAVVEAVKHFYAYLDGCVNLHIKSDASNVIGLYSHITGNDSDELSRFRAELTSLGVMREMLVHRPVGAMESESDSNDSFITASENIMLEPEQNIVGMMMADMDEYDDDDWSDSDDQAPMDRCTIFNLIHDGDIQRWIEICQARDETEEEDYTPDMDEVEFMHIHNNILEYVVPTHIPGIQSRWVPVLPLHAAENFVKQAHKELAHPGYTRTLAYVDE
ncbi:hypothetical protein COEREDRAFT_12021 [Coemansia reversa NRRL 1564]|uniref:Reverse transcriptase RNase H-like domain-containing protein n=1 Tax=Coemansia reversa (strain ATCC 12441 / NRRL 1564) TaxID=763665 RepID=A0A2G5B1I9_COERN|nr:hypothetical protein COEREDRAFT_12021 [Coemansia reversa NRRL 1564]|eukprot:PIA12888.1 hypothetical protein COEREDRAFT_12021 [Coemansia reversa NRRL 1564]